MFPCKISRSRTGPAAGLPQTLRAALEEYFLGLAARSQAALTVELKRVHLARFLRRAQDIGSISLMDQIDIHLLERFRQAVCLFRMWDGLPPAPILALARESLDLLWVRAKTPARERWQS